MKIKTLVLSPFDVNTYIVSDETGECVIIDPACYNSEENEILSDYIKSNNLKPVKLLNTHCHLDHVFGNKYISDTYNLNSESNINDLFLIENFTKTVSMYGLKASNPYKPGSFIDESNIIKFGNSELNILHIPGHSPGSIVFYNEKDKFAIVGDVIFAQSIGRTDLPGGNYETLISGIKTKLFKLDNNLVLFPGHGPSTTIGTEKRENPFLK
jgi:glyoxylase-like metal-dependent hydrolase (beta-lactamase superfamily II)